MSINEDVGRIIKMLIRKEPFYGFFLMTTDRVISRSIKTFAVGLDGINVKLIINPDFFYSLTESHRYGVLLHEVLHLCYFHLFTHMKFANKELDNIACDLEINQYIDRSLLPDNAIFLDKINQEYSINMLPKMGRKYYYEELNKLPKESIQKLCDLSPEHNWPESQSSDLEVVEQQLINKIEDVYNSSQRDILPGHLKDLIKLIQEKRSKINWKSRLRMELGISNMINLRNTRLKPNYYFNTNPANRLRFYQKILCILDTSGSVSRKELEDFLTEINILKNFGFILDVSCIDAKMSEVKEYRGGDLEIFGRGGTDFQPGIDYLERSNYTTMIYFTDGEAPCPTNSKKKVIWVLSKNGNDSTLNKHNGKIVRIQ